MREDLLRTIALDFEMDRETFHNLGDDGVADSVFDASVDYYTRKRNALARPFLASMKQIAESDQDNKPEKVFIDFTDGRRIMRAVVSVETATESGGQEVNDAIERVAMLSYIDAHWTEHLRNLDELKEAIGLRAYGQRDPLIEYKMEAFKLFAEMIEEINRELVSFIFRSGPLVDKQAPPRAKRSTARRLDPKKAKSTHESQSPSYDVNASGSNSAARKDPTVKEAPVTVAEKVGRNDPCPCGSGKKYKHCHGR